MPSQFVTAYGDLGKTLAGAEEQRLAAAKQVGTLFGDVFGFANSQSKG
jgi:hypothetical protein